MRHHQKSIMKFTGDIDKSGFNGEETETDDRFMVEQGGRMRRKQRFAIQRQQKNRGRY